MGRHLLPITRKLASRETVTFVTPKAIMFPQAKFPVALCCTYPPTKHKHSIVLNILLLTTRPAWIYLSTFFFNAMRCFKPSFLFCLEISLSQSNQYLCLSTTKCAQNSFICWFTAVLRGTFLSGACLRSKRFVPLSSNAVLKHVTLCVLFVDEGFDRVITKTFMKQLPKTFALMIQNWGDRWMEISYNSYQITEVVLESYQLSMET